MGKFVFAIFLFFISLNTISAQMKKYQFEIEFSQYGNIAMEKGVPSNSFFSGTAKSAPLKLNSSGKDVIVRFVTDIAPDGNAKYFINEDVETTDYKEIPGEKIFDDYLKFEVTIDSGRSALCHYKLEIIVHPKSGRLIFRHINFDNFKSFMNADDQNKGIGTGITKFPQIKVGAKFPVYSLKPFMEKIKEKFRFIIIYWFSSGSKTLLAEYNTLHNYFKEKPDCSFLAIDWSLSDKPFTRNDDYSRYDENSVYYFTSRFPRYTVVNTNGIVIHDSMGFTGGFMEVIGNLGVK